jgi:formylglycine-generating enzyme required for sulfatase activity
MAGNVWEWGSSLDKLYPYKTNDGRKDREAKGDRVLRGGSWGSLHWFACCAYRDAFFPSLRDYRFGGIGFRVVVSLS